MRKVIVLIEHSKDATAPEIPLHADDEIISAHLSKHIGPSGFGNDIRARLEVIVAREDHEEYVS